VTQKAYNFDLMSVLIVDDNKHMQMLVTTILQGFGVRDIRVASDAATAFSELHTGNVDLVICEYRLTPVNGLEFIKMVRTAQDSRDKLVPILMLTAHSEMEHVMSARDSGVTDFMAKPVSPAGLYKHIAMMIEHPRQFVRSRKFVGPDRRRRDSAEFEGPNRRER
jgi:two-component system, chemotaxis family, chemotaxis protein CheY